MKIVRTQRYIEDQKKLKTSPSDVEALERAISMAPESGSVIQV